MLAKLGAKNYFTNGLWAKLSLITTFLLVILPFMVWIGYTQEIMVVVALTTVLIYAKILYFLRGFDSLSLLIAMILDVASSLRSFFVVVAVVMFGFSVSFYVSDTDSYAEGLHESIWYSFLLIFGMTDLNEGTWVTVTSGSVYMVIMVVILMNLLVAVIMDGFERVMERARLSMRREKAQMICDAELLMTQWELNSAHKFPLWIHALVPADDTPKTGHYQTWQGRTWNTKQHVTAEMHKTRTAIGEDLKAIATQVRENLDEHMAKIQETIEISEERLNAIGTA